MLLLECKPDEIVARRLGRTRRECVHHNDKGRVCNVLKKTEGLTGMIDEDPRAAQPPYLETLKEISNDHDIRVLQDSKRGHSVVIVCPRLEEWLIKTAAESGLKMEEFGLSDRGNALHREINSRLPALEKLLDALLEAKSKRLLHVQELIR
jgi:hypothetical protein